MQRVAMGYQALVEMFELKVIPHYRASYIRKHGAVKVASDHSREEYEYPKSYQVEDIHDPLAQLEFALKYDGFNLEIMKSVFERIEKECLCKWVQSKPNGRFNRIVWFLYEWLFDEVLDLEDIKRRDYVHVLDPALYFTGEPIKSRRHGVNNNLLGNRIFCPIIRRTKLLESYIGKELDKKTLNIVKKYDPKVIDRASNYLLTKETMSSYQIEREQPDKARLTKFINLLERIEKINEITKDILIECQNIIVDPRFVDSDYRQTQNYVGENINIYLQKIHYISPKPSDIQELMDGLLLTLKSVQQSECHPVLIATAISFGFVFLHPFEDGNGRLHRFLIHYILKKLKFSPDGIIFPISAIMLQKIAEYDRALEMFSKPLMEIVTDYELDNNGVLTVGENTKVYYQYIDYTVFAEYLFQCIEETIDSHLKGELDFIVKYDRTKLAIQSVIDMPDKIIDLYIRCILQNNGKLGDKKRKKHFEFLTKEEVSELTDIVVNNFELG
ncbi:MAG: cell filamentation protein Fic [Legionellales bacterium]|nr:cell filamentation protein Fic [Legionellales bacterium]|tara:strand:+ start:11123 stop:12622 length:1500 start_codon:yes stop_codon:yes gene_type:complete